MERSEDSCLVIRPDSGDPAETLIEVNKFAPIGLQCSSAVDSALPQYCWWLLVNDSMSINWGCKMFRLLQLSMADAYMYELNWTELNKTIEMSPVGHQDSGRVFWLLSELCGIQGSAFLPENHSRRRHRPSLSGRGENKCGCCTALGSSWLYFILYILFCIWSFYIPSCCRFPDLIITSAIRNILTWPKWRKFKKQYANFHCN